MGYELQKLQIITKQARGRFRTPGRVVDSRSTPKRITIDSLTSPMWQAALRHPPRRNPTSLGENPRHGARLRRDSMWRDSTWRNVEWRNPMLCGETPHRVAKSHVARWESTTRPGVRSRPRACFVIICYFCNSSPLKVVDFGRIRVFTY